jgi:hypothetical protein
VQDDGSLSKRITVLYQKEVVKKTVINYTDFGMLQEWLSNQE